MWFIVCGVYFICCVVFFYTLVQFVMYRIELKLQCVSNNNNSVNKVTNFHLLAKKRTQNKTIYLLIVSSQILFQYLFFFEGEFQEDKRHIHWKKLARISFFEKKKWKLVLFQNPDTKIKMTRFMLKCVIIICNGFNNNLTANDVHFV